MENTLNSQKIVPHLWFDREAMEAAECYASAFGDSRIVSTIRLPGTPSGDAEVVEFEIMGYRLMAISAGPLFRINPSISFHARCATPAEVDRLWEKLSPGGLALMELGEYPFSRRYGWMQDRFGVSWQIIHPERPFRQRIMPALMFTGAVCGRAEEAIHFYASVFRRASSQIMDRYGEGEEPDCPGTVRYAEFVLDGQEFAAMDSGWPHAFGFNEAVSLVVRCEDQEEIDALWRNLSAVPEAEQCGWIKDKFGVSWQILPANMGELLARNPEKTVPVMLKMQRIVIDDLEKAGRA